MKSNGIMHSKVTGIGFKAISWNLSPLSERKVSPPERQAHPILDQPRQTTDRPTADYYRPNVGNSQPEAYQDVRGTTH